MQSDDNTKNGSKTETPRNPLQDVSSNRFGVNSTLTNSCADDGAGTITTKKRKVTAY